MALDYRPPLWFVGGTSEEKYLNGRHDLEDGQGRSPDEDTP